jgi:hypothetical protein
LVKINDLRFEFYFYTDNFFVTDSKVKYNIMSTIDWNNYNFGGDWHRPEPTPHHHSHAHHQEQPHHHTHKPKPEPFNDGGALLRVDTALEDRKNDDAKFMTKHSGEFSEFNSDDIDNKFTHIINTQRVASNPDVVGTVNWDYLHMRTLRYAKDPENPTDDEVEDMEAELNLFFQNMGCVQKCTKHIMEYSAKHPVKLTSREAFVWWAWAAHNDVNHRNGKAIFSRDEFIRRYITNMAGKLDGSSKLNHILDAVHNGPSGYELLFSIILLAVLLVGIFYVTRWLWARRATNSHHTNQATESSIETF